MENLSEKICRVKEPERHKTEIQTTKDRLTDNETDIQEKPRKTARGRNK